MFSAFSAVINLKAYLCVYGVAKVLIQSSGNLGTLDLAAMKALVCRQSGMCGMGFGDLRYGTAVFSHISVPYREPSLKDLGKKMLLFSKLDIPAAVITDLL